MDEKQFRELTARLDAIIRLLAINVATGKTSKERIELLFDAGLRPVEIARVLRISENYVNVTLSKLRKENKAEKEEETKPDQTGA